jgi:hypothetical protein
MNCAVVDVGRTYGNGMVWNVVVGKHKYDECTCMHEYSTESYKPRPNLQQSNITTVDMSR